MENTNLVESNHGRLNIVINRGGLRMEDAEFCSTCVCRCCVCRCSPGGDPPVTAGETPTSDR
jgi:hypothetical protein